MNEKSAAGSTAMEMHSPYNEEINHAAAPNPFASPFASTRASSIRGASAVDLHQHDINSRYFHSRRVKKGEVERPWLDKKDPREKWVTIIPLIGIGLGLAIAGFLIYDGLSSVVNHNYCPVLDEDWSRGFNTDVWTKEAQVGGFGYVERTIHSRAYQSLTERQQRRV